MSINIAIDGPAGAGKSSIARAVSERLGYIYVDTGALYRAIGLYAIRNSVPTTDMQAITDILPNIKIELKYIDGEQRVLLNGEDVSHAIRMPNASMAASNVSSIPAVRDFLFDLQKDIANQNDVIMDGRDIGTVVLPDAQVKIFLTASTVVRAERRFNELQLKGIDVDLDELINEIEQRDYQDMSREIAPLKQAKDAVLVDTSDLDLKESIEKVISVIKKSII